MWCDLASRGVDPSRLALSGFCVLLSLSMGMGCASLKKQPPALQPPVVSSTVSYHVGAPIAWATTRPVADVAADDALLARASWIALSDVPRALQPVLSEATLIAAPRSADPFLASGQLSRGAQIVAQPQVEAFLADIERGAFGQHVPIARTMAALPRDVTATFNLGDAAQHVQVDLYRPLNAAPAATNPTDLIQLSLALQDPSGRRERLLLDAKPMALPARLALVVPSQFPAQGVKAIVAIVELAAPSDSPDHRQAVAECVAQLKQSAANAASTPSLPVDAASGWAGLAAALRAMDQPNSTRAAIAYLARETGATMFGDVGLVAPDATLSELRGRVHQRVGEQNAMAPEQLGWLLDVVTLEQLAALQSANKMPPELSGVLARIAGEAARNAGSLEELTKVQGRVQLQARLIAENFTYLEDASPAARVRAYDWLKMRGRAPANYDPLGPAKQRAAAIDAALNAAADPPAADAPAADAPADAGAIPAAAAAKNPASEIDTMKATRGAP